MIDLRSDTVTQPTPEMRAFMLDAAVGDDVFGDDPTVNELEALGASIFGKEAALFCASGTMTNQIAINVHTVPGDEVICHEEAHIYRYEGGGIARNSGASVRFIRGNQGRISPELLEGTVNNPDDPHYPISKMVSLEDTANRGGGRCYDFSAIEKIAAFCKKHHLKLHLDGARVFNALAVNKMDPKIYGKAFDTISICLSKGLGAPVGSLLLGSADFIKKARRVRKVFGGGMRQAGIIAAGGVFALKHHVERLAEDHKNAKQIGELLASKNWIKEVLPVETNIVVGHVADGWSEMQVVEKLLEKGIHCVAFGAGRIRMTTHLHIGESEMKDLANKLPDTLT